LNFLNPLNHFEAILTLNVGTVERLKSQEEVLCPIH
jgi:hypothetical protein